MKTYFKNKKAFTLIELLIVIAIIGILFIVLVSKVDFATDKAKASGVQTDFRSFQTAFEQVARENSGYATLGWDTGDDNGDRLRNSYDKGDNGAGGGIAHNGIQDGSEVFVGSKEYGETWTNTFTLVNPSDAKDSSAFIALENAINANLDPKLHITLTPNTDASGNLTGSAAITMANQARDPWKNEYAGAYISNAIVDNLDRGSIIMYSTGANGQLGTNYSVSGGLVGVEVPGGNINGKDDYVLSVTYSYANGYGEVQTGTAGFSNNQNTLTSNPIVDNGVNAGGMSAGVGSVPGGNGTPNQPSEPAGPGEGGYEMLSGDEVTVTNGSPVVFRSSANVSDFVGLKIDGQTMPSNSYGYTSGSTIVTISGSTIDSLSKGEHDIEIVSIDGSAKAKLYINYECSIDHRSLYAYNTLVCPDCETFSCDGSCYDSIDDGICMCDWCGLADFAHVDNNTDGYCDKCNVVYCRDGGDCHDLDHDGYCDCCGWNYNDGMYPHEVDVDDLDNDGYCDSCKRHFVHYDTDDGYCDACNIIYCEDQKIHHSSGEWYYCDWCYKCVQCQDDDFDGVCDNCYEPCEIQCPGHTDEEDHNGLCDTCNQVHCDVLGIRRDIDKNGQCDSCNQRYVCSHYDEGYCDDYCDWCNLCYYCQHVHVNGSCPTCSQDGYCEYGDRDDNGDGICDCCGSSC